MGLQVLAVPGSLRRHSYNRLLLRAAAQQVSAPPQVTEFTQLGQVDPFN